MRNLKAWLPFISAFVLFGILSHLLSSFASSTISSFATMHPIKYQAALIFFGRNAFFCNVFLLISGSILIPGNLIGLFQFGNGEVEAGRIRKALLWCIASLSIVTLISIVAIMIIVGKSG